MNVEKLIEWGTTILTYQDKGDYSDISPQFSIKYDSFERLKDDIPNKALSALKSLVNQTYQSQIDFEIALKAIDSPLDETSIQLICDRANLGQKRFDQKFGWIEEYRDDIAVYEEMLNLAPES